VIIEDNGDITPKLVVTCCIVESDGKVLLIKRSQHKPQPGKWGLPGGKVDAGESLEAAMVRELREETGISIDVTDLRFIDAVLEKHDDYYLKFGIFFLAIPRPEITLNSGEHEEFGWFEPSRVSTQVDGIEDLVECLALYYKELG
jgi:8-oxo-dGTP diphosphatase